MNPSPINPPTQSFRTYPVRRPIPAARNRVLGSLLCSATAALLSLLAAPAEASIAYGSINNFDTVNDTGHECHGFEIELEDCHSTDITYTYNYNHYGTPHITEDNSVAGHPKCIVRWESAKKADGTWAAFTAIPAGPIAPTQGHSFTNPGVNFGGEHFGAGYKSAPTKITYHWLLDNGAGALVLGPVVDVATPAFTYYPGVGGAAAQVQAVIVPPPAPPVLEFGKAIWVKEIRTTTHNANKVKLRDLVSDDPIVPPVKNWKNGEPDEVEIEWQILQTEFAAANGGANGELAGAAENLPNGNEVVTRRYEFYKYTGPLDVVGEAMGDKVAADGIHGVGMKLIDGVNVDLSARVVVGDYLGAQMAAVDVDAQLGLIDHMEDGKKNTAYTARTLVIQGKNPVTTTTAGALPAGMNFNTVTGIVSGLPTASGVFTFKVTATDGVAPAVSKNYTFSIAAVGAPLAPHAVVDTVASPLAGGTTSGDGSFAIGANATVTAVANPTYTFLNWTDNGAVVSNAATYTFAVDVNHSLVANFGVPRTIVTLAAPVAGGTTGGGGIVADGSSATLVATPNPGYTFVNWTEGGVQVSAAASTTFTATVNRTLTANFAPIVIYTVSTGAAPALGGTTTGGGTYQKETNATVTATANAGFAFVNWTVGGSPVSASASYTFSVTANRALTANFTIPGTPRTIATSASPTIGGTTSGAGTYPSGTSATVVATPNLGYKFSAWKEGSSTVSSGPSYTFVVGANRTLVAKFTEAFVITATASPSVGGTTEMDSSTYKTGDNAQAKAFPAAGYTFANWTVNGAVVSTNATYSFNVTGNRALVANFNWTAGVTITTTSAPAIGGTTFGDGGYLLGDSITVSAFANPGYVFVNWKVGATVVSDLSDYTFTAATNRALTANFASAVTITASASPAAGGSISGDGDYFSGASATLVATPNNDYTFVNWTEGGAIVSSSASYTFAVAGARTLVANFMPAYTITASASPAPGGTITGAATVHPGTGVTLVAFANTDYTFVNWTDDFGTEVSVNPSYTFTPIASGNYTANFDAGLTGVHFTFDTGIPALALHQTAPFDQTVAGITASFSSPNAAQPTIETEASSGLVFSNFAAHYLASAGAESTIIDVQFSQPMIGVAFKFATMENANLPLGTNIRLTATDHSSGAAVAVGSALAHGTTTNGDSYPTGLLTFNVGVAQFDSIRIEMAGDASAAQHVLIDNLIASPAISGGGTMVLANPNWNITLSDFGYSDYLLDNTPGFEGREYLSGEWASAIGYVKNGVAVSPTWFDPQFLYPDWASNSNFLVVQGIHLIGANASNLPIAESTIANSDLQITLRFEMVDTVTGTPMGTSAASDGTAGKSVNSNRYVLNESFTVTNISGVPITNVQMFQFLHGLSSQRGTYDNRSYAGKLAEYRYDVSLAGVDSGSAGASSSAVGLEDHIGFHAKVAPTAFELGYYGIDDGTDNHFNGKPSDGVHRSVEANWLGSYSARKGRDSFAPPTRWVSGAQRWVLGDLLVGGTATHDVLLSLLTGTKVTTDSGGHHGHGSCNGGSSRVGGADFDFDNISATGTLFCKYSKADAAELTERETDGEFVTPTFQTPDGGTAMQLWNVTYNGAFAGNLHLTFAYDPALLPLGFDESTLVIYHFHAGAWEKLTGAVDKVNHTITIATTSLSPFALGFAPGVAVQIPASGSGTVTGGGSYAIGTSVTLTATAQSGYWFTGWSDGGTVVSTAQTYTFTMAGSRALTANFAPIPRMAAAAAGPGTMVFKWPSNLAGWQLQESPSLDAGSWVNSTRAVTTVGAESQITANVSEGRRFFRLVHL